MQVSVENTGALERRMTVQVPAERIDEAVKSRLQSMTRTVRLDGFRPGKVPYRVVEKRFGPQVRAEAMGELISNTYQEAIQQENLRPAGQPSIDPPEAKPGEPLEYVATFEVYPEVTFKPLDGIALTRPVAEITEADVDAMLEKLRKQRATWDAVERPAELGDRVVVDFEGTVGGEPFSGNKASNAPIELGSDTMIEGFEAQLVGVKAGDERTLAVTFPEDYRSTDVAGKAAEFKVKVHTVAAPSLPALDDEFARTFGVGDGGLEGLRAEVRKNMERELRQAIRNRVKRAVFDALLEQNAVDVPKSLVEDEMATLTKQDTGQAGSRPVEQLEAEARRRVALGLLIAEIIKQNQLQIDPERVREEVESIASSYEKPDEVVQWYYSNQEMLSGVQSYVMEDIVADWVMENAQVEDKPMSFDEAMQ